MYQITTATHQSNFWLYPAPMQKEVTVNDVIDAGCIALHVDRAKLLSKSRKQELVRARFILMHIIKIKFKKLSLDKIAAIFGKKDHTTVLHAIQTVKDDLSITAYRHETNELIRSVMELL